MDASWLWVANYFRELSEVHGSVETAKIREAFKLAGGSRRFRRVIRWDAAFVGACLRLSGYACPSVLGAEAYREFGKSLGGNRRRGCIVVLEDDLSLGGNKRVGFLEKAEDEAIEVLEACMNGRVVISIYDRARVLEYRWPTEIAALPQDTSLPTIIKLSPDNAPLHVKFAVGNVESLPMSRAFAYWDRTGELTGDFESRRLVRPAVIESVVIAPVVRPLGEEVHDHSVEFGRELTLVRASSPVGAGISLGTGGSEVLEARLDTDTMASRHLLGPEVVALQNALEAGDFNLGEVDGVFGHRTRAAVLSVQSQCGLPLTGVADEETWKALSVGNLRLPHMEFIAVADAEQPDTTPAPGTSAGRPVQQGDGGTSDPKRTQLYFATTRRPVGDDNSAEFNDERRRELAFGSIVVNVPPADSYKIGTIPKPTQIKPLGLWTIWRGSDDENKHFFVRRKSRFTRKEFCDAVSGNESEQALVFVHGFNTTFEDAALRLAQVASDLQFEGAPILFAWPSHGGVLAYWYDRESAMFSREAFLDLLNILQTETRLKTIHVIAHSMGNQIVVDALATLGKSVLSKSLAEVILAAPDVDRDVFHDLGSRIKALARGVTLYASGSDRALILSRKVARFPRAGDVPNGGPVVVANVDTIDASAVGSELLSLNHSKYATERSLIDDLNRLIRDGERPPNHRSADIIGIPIGATPNYWRYRD